jgi:dynactin-4
MLVSYTYRSDDPAPSESNDAEASTKASKPPEIKTFAFYTVVDLGQIIPRDELKGESGL